MNSFIVEESESKERLDTVLVSRYPDKSRSFWAKAIAKGHITVNSESAKSGTKVAAGAKVNIQIPDTEKIPVEIPVIYEDDDMVVIDKPEGVLVHEKGNFDQEFTVVDFMDDLYTGSNERKGIVHRLDRTTSGVMVVAKNDEVATDLQLQFANRLVEKEYLAISSGAAKDDAAIIDLPIERNPKQPNSFRVGANGKESSTSYEVLESKDGLTKVSLKPKTGRTHQLRVHMAYVGLPILGDVMYGGSNASRVMLHANKLTVNMPNGERKTFVSEPPKEFGYE